MIHFIIDVTDYFQANTHIPPPASILLTSPPEHIPAASTACQRHFKLRHCTGPV